jgi:myo-inositol-1-phosphate synthase
LSLPKPQLKRVGGIRKDQMGERLGVAVVGLGGAVATTAVAGIEMIKEGGRTGLSGLPLADRDVPGMSAYRDMGVRRLGPQRGHAPGCLRMRHGVIGGGRAE